MKAYQKRLASLLLSLTGGLLLAPSVQAMDVQEDAGADSVATCQISGIGKPVILRQQRGRYQISCQTLVKSTIEKRISDHYTSYRVKDLEVLAVSTEKNGIRTRKNRDGQTDTIRYVMMANGMELSASQVGGAYYAMGLVPVIKFEEIKRENA